MHYFGAKIVKICIILVQNNRKKQTPTIPASFEAKNDNGGNGIDWMKALPAYDAGDLLQLHFEIFQFLRNVRVTVEERQTVDIELLAFQAELTNICSLDLVQEDFLPLIGISIIFCTFVATLHLEIRCKDTQFVSNNKTFCEKFLHKMKIIFSGYG